MDRRAHGRLAAAGRLHRLRTLQLRRRGRGTTGLTMLVGPEEWIDGPGTHLAGWRGGDGASIVAQPVARRRRDAGGARTGRRGPGSGLGGTPAGSGPAGGRPGIRGAGGSQSAPRWGPRPYVPRSSGPPGVWVARGSLGAWTRGWPRSLALPFSAVGGLDRGARPAGDQRTQPPMNADGLPSGSGEPCAAVSLRRERERDPEGERERERG